MSERQEGQPADQPRELISTPLTEPADLAERFAAEHERRLEKAVRSAEEHRLYSRGALERGQTILREEAGQIGDSRLAILKTELVSIRKRDFQLDSEPDITSSRIDGEPNLQQHLAELADIIDRSRELRYTEPVGPALHRQQQLQNLRNVVEHYSRRAVYITPKIQANLQLCLAELSEPSADNQVLAPLETIREILDSNQPRSGSYSTLTNILSLSCFIGEAFRTPGPAGLKERLIGEIQRLVWQDLARVAVAYLPHPQEDEDPEESASQAADPHLQQMIATAYTHYLATLAEAGRSLKYSQNNESQERAIEGYLESITAPLVADQSYRRYGNFIIQGNEIRKCLAEGETYINRVRMLCKGLTIEGLVKTVDQFAQSSWTYQSIWPAEVYPSCFGLIDGLIALKQYPTVETIAYRLTSPEARIVVWAKLAAAYRHDPELKTHEDSGLAISSLPESERQRWQQNRPRRLINVAEQIVEYWPMSSQAHDQARLTIAETLLNIGEPLPEELDLAIAAIAAPFEQAEPEVDRSWRRAQARNLLSRPNILPALKIRATQGQLDPISLETLNQVAESDHRSLNLDVIKGLAEIYLNQKQYETALDLVLNGLDQYERRTGMKYRAMFNFLLFAHRLSQLFQRQRGNTKKEIFRFLTTLGERDDQRRKIDQIQKLSERIARGIFAPYKGRIPWIDDPVAHQLYCQLNPRNRYWTRHKRPSPDYDAATVAREARLLAQEGMREKAYETSLSAQKLLREPVAIPFKPNPEPLLIEARLDLVEAYLTMERFEEAIYIAHAIPVADKQALALCRIASTLYASQQQESKTRNELPRPSQPPATQVNLPRPASDPALESGENPALAPGD